LNELDSFLQTNEAKILFSSEQRDRVVSESLIRKVFSQINPQDIKKTLIDYAKYLSSKGAFKGMKGHTILSVDGSAFGGRYGVWVQICGNYPCIVNYQMYSKYGDEYKAALKAVEEVFKELNIKNCIVCADGLSLREGFFDMCNKNGAYGFVRYTPKKGKRKPLIIREADECFEDEKLQRYIECEEFKDEERDEEVEIKCVRGLEYGKKKVKRKVNVIRVREICCKSGQVGEYYIVSDYNFGFGKKVLSLKDARELAKGKGRWQIEINGFKQANQLFGTKTKHVYKNSYKSEQRMFN
jgi:hypothetical protein